MIDQRELAIKWYDELDFIEQIRIDAMVKNYQSFVGSRSRTQASGNMGKELIHKMIMKGYLK